MRLSQLKQSAELQKERQSKAYGQLTELTTKQLMVG